MIRQTRPLGLLLLAIWTVGTGCAIHSGSASTTPPPVVTNAAQSGSQDRMQGIAELEDYLKASPDPEKKPWVMAWAGEQRRLSGDDESARQWWEMVRSTYGDHRANHTAVLGLAVLNSREDPQGNVLATLQLIKPEGIPDTLNADRYRILARVAFQDGASQNEIDELVEKAMTYANADAHVASRVSLMLEDLIPDDIEPVIRPQEPEQKTIAALEAAFRDDRFDAVIQKGETFLRTWPESENAARIGYMVKRARAGDPTVEGQVSVLLPLSGRYEKPGKNLQALIELANTQMESPLTLLFVDTTAAVVEWEANHPAPETPTEEEAPKATTEEALPTGEAVPTEEEVEEFDHAEHIRGLIEDAVLVDGSVAILGPLLKEFSIPAADTAQAIAVPMLSLSRTHSPTEAGDYVFRGQLPDSQQVQALIHHAVQDLGLTQLAMLHPQNSYGEQLRVLFEDAIEAEGATLVRIVTYDPTVSDFRPVGQELGQKDYELRAEEFDHLRRRSRKAVLPPIIDFEGLIIADSWKRAAMISNGLAYEEFPIGNFKPNRYSPTIPLFGLNSWHDKRIIELGGEYIQGAVLVDAFSAVHSGVAAEEWVQVYRENFNGQKPKVLHAVTWDTTRLLATAILAGGPDREEIRDALVEVEIVDPVGSGSRFGEDREVDRDLLLLRIKGGNFVSWVSPVDETETGEEIAP